MLRQTHDLGYVVCNSPLRIMLVLGYLFLFFENVGSDKFMNFEN